MIDSNPSSCSKKKFVGKKSIKLSQSNPTNLNHSILKSNQISNEIKNNSILNDSIKNLLPSNYNFELPKIIHQIRLNQIQILALQFPEDIIILGDVTYGACCIDDFTAKSLGCQMLVHFGHSCLIPIDQTSIKTLYVFVEISIDRQHLFDTVINNFPNCLENLPSNLKHIKIQHEINSNHPFHLALVGTVQFISALQALKCDLENHNSLNHLALPSTHHLDHSKITKSFNSWKITLPQIKPLSPGEILGCTAPKLPHDTDAILYLGDGRFHLESIMIANPTIPAYRYDPYEKKITHEEYDHLKMKQLRSKAISKASQSLQSSSSLNTPNEKDWAIILGTLGRQGSLSVLKSISNGFKSQATHSRELVPILLSELSPLKLNLFHLDIQVFVQTSCPRLSIDWGESFNVPLLNPYEAKVCFGQAKPFQVDSSDDQLLDSYPMDFYADDSLGDWTPRFGRARKRISKPTS
ncbi:hypothetical protein O181_081316 [Austropuccinia psidii MF-1]|uniref:2-(3-amino-3-carboxypropyl)histidine synthase subunit 1 n=1 Tax=Austropuccinia psidii MF-1 TaxID=1389203 RepID=A0A9Q3IFU4_9BASI|nr:hypothetical protein [Austropuccinia psidii MF-1]